jgi:hypothetical protein
LSKNLRACPVIVQAVTSCSDSLPVPLSNTSVPASAARRYDASDSAKPASSSGGSRVSPDYTPRNVGLRGVLPGCRRVLRSRAVEPYRVIAPKDREEGAGGPDTPVPRFLSRQWARGSEVPHG